MSILCFSHKACLIRGACVAFNGFAEQPSAGEQIKKGAKTFGTGVRGAAVDVGKTIGTGTRKTVKEIGSAFSKDAKTAATGREAA